MVNFILLILGILAIASLIFAYFATRSGKKTTH